MRLGEQMKRWVIVSLLTFASPFLTGCEQTETKPSNVPSRELNGHTAAVLLNGHTDGVQRVAISPDSRWLVTGSDDSTARLWDLKRLTSN